MASAQSLRLFKGKRHIKIKPMAYTFHDYLPSAYTTYLPGVYAIINRNNNKLYIGSAVNLSHRWSAHRHDMARDRQNKHFLRAFKKDPIAFEIYVVEELPGCTRDYRIEREQFWIDFYKSYLRDRGYNMCPKARSCEGAKHGPEYGAAISKRVKGTKWTEEAKERFKHRKKATVFRKFTDEQKKKQSEQRKGKKQSKESVLKRAESLRGIRYPHHGRPVFQVSESGEIIKKFDAILYASRELDICDNKIRVSLKNPTWKAGGFYWRDARNCSVVKFEIPIGPITNSKRVIQMDKNLNVIKTFNSLAEASREIGKASANISYLCTHRLQGTCGGFKWRYE